MRVGWRLAPEHGSQPLPCHFFAPPERECPLAADQVRPRPLRIIKSNHLLVADAAVVITCARHQAHPARPTKPVKVVPGTDASVLSHTAPPIRYQASYGSICEGPTCRNRLLRPIPQNALFSAADCVRQVPTMAPLHSRRAASRLSWATEATATASLQGCGGTVPGGEHESEALAVAVPADVEPGGGDQAHPQGPMNAPHLVVGTTTSGKNHCSSWVRRITSLPGKTLISTASDPSSPP